MIRYKVLYNDISDVHILLIGSDHDFLMFRAAHTFMLNIQLSYYELNTLAGASSPPSPALITPDPYNIIKT